ncbi:MAG TPA: GNAT family N-acetyltransferase, partial [Actinomycetota bacterium]|nr:GNAT family N-acetyltransferase [Actinomycetota bacterium]
MRGCAGAPPWGGDRGRPDHPAGLSGIRRSGRPGLGRLPGPNRGRGRPSRSGARPGRPGGGAHPGLGHPRSEEARLGDDPIEPGTVNMRMLGVDPRARGRGAGRALVEACVRRARQGGKRALTLHTTQAMTVAQNLYTA